MGKKGKRKSPRTYYNRAGRKNKHHIKAKSKGGSMKPSNLILLDENRHAAYHLIFHNMSFIEAARLLVRTYNIKKGTHYNLIQGGGGYGEKEREDY
jgi:protease II